MIEKIERAITASELSRLIAENNETAIWAARPTEPKALAMQCRWIAKKWAEDPTRQAKDIRLLEGIASFLDRQSN